jgi:Dolichyl-phosphate-mannose-protein mannosyltransferase
MRTIPLLAAAAVFLVHLFANPHYGFFRDELYFIICGFHPQFGYVDQPPVVPLLSAASQTFGHSLFLLRALPALFAAAGVYATCMLVAEFGGGAFAQVLAALVFFFAPVLMSFGMKVSTDMVGLWTWPLIALLVVRITKGADLRLWLAVGALAGLSVESKYSVLLFLAALVLGTLLAPQRRALFSAWFAAGCALGAAIALPNLLWQWHYGFPMMQLLEAGQNGKNVIVGPITYLFQEVLITGLLLAAVWIIGLVRLLRNADFRYLGYAYILLIGEMLLFHGKHYYPADVYPILIAAGAAAVESWTRSRALARGVVTALVIISGLVLVPMTLPVLPEATFVSYDTELERVLHLPRNATETEHGRDQGALPGDWADMHGWTEIASTVQRVYDALPPDQRAQAVVFAGNYGEAAAVQFYDPSIPVISEHNQYWLWGTRGYNGSVVVQVNGSCFESDRLFASRTLASHVSDPWAIRYENGIPIWVCRGIRKPLAQVWPKIKLYE